MSEPARPRQVDQLDGSRFAGLNCTCAAAAMALDRHTIGAHRTTGAKVRSLTGDTIGGTTLRQVAAALERGWDVQLDVQLDITFITFEQRLHRGQGAILQGWEAVTRDTKWSASETFGGNHAWYVNEGRGWHQRADGLWLADEFLVFDPLADGRRDAIADAPFWIPRDIVQKWAGRLDVSDPVESYVPLGIGRVYAAFTRDTEPHAHLHFGAHRADPFPDTVTTHPKRTGGRVNVRRGPGSSYALVEKLPAGRSLEMYQVTHGATVDGVSKWFGNHNGDRWINGSRLRGKGGTT